MNDKKTTVLLINPGHEGKSGFKHTVPHKIHRDIPPISILTLGSYLRKYGENVAILDTHIDQSYRENIKKIISEENVFIVCITTFIGNFIKNACEITEYVKSIDSKIPVVWGGPLTSTLSESCLKEGRADYIVFFYGEEPLRLLIRALRNKTSVENIPNIGFLKAGAAFYTKPSNDSVIYNDVLDWSLVGDNINIAQVPYLAYIFTSRGCLYNCRFCYHQTSIEKKFNKFSLRDPENVLVEEEYLYNNYGTNIFTIGDDNFFTDKKRAIKILAGMKEKDFFIEQTIGTFSDLNNEIISYLQGVCQTIICSIETASEKLLKLLKKPIKLQKIPEINSKLTQAQINTIHNFMFGLPGETDGDRKAAVELMIKLKEINPYVRGVPYFFTPLPGTPMFEDIENEFGVKFPKTLSFWEDCEFIGLDTTYKFRPWLNKDEQMFIGDFITLFKEIFQSLNEPLTKEQKSIINNSSRMKYIFSEICKVKFPKDRTPQYLLDVMLNEKNITG